MTEQSPPPRLPLVSRPGIRCRTTVPITVPPPAQSPGKPPATRCRQAGAARFEMIVHVPPLLVVIGGLPATGKSTVANLLVERLSAPYLRVDRIEQAIVAWSALDHPVGVVGYGVAYALALDQLSLGLDVIVECVNPLAVTRDAWLSTAEDTGAVMVEVELVCTDPLEHRRRVETRVSDVEGLLKPTWEQVAAREYEPWHRPHLLIDTTCASAAEAAERITTEAAAIRRRTAGS